jgi:hypothetical protein
MIYHGEGNKLTAQGNSYYKIFNYINEDHIKLHGKEFEGTMYFAKLFSYEVDYEVFVNDETREEVIATLKKIEDMYRRRR